MNSLGRRVRDSIPPSHPLGDSAKRRESPVLHPRLTRQRSGRTTRDSRAGSLRTATGASLTNVFLNAYTVRAPVPAIVDGFVADDRFCALSVMRTLGNSCAALAAGAVLP
jgi:hypothetical protein